MNRALARRCARWAGPLVAGCAAAYAVAAGGWSPVAVVAPLIVVGLLGWYASGELSVARTPLGEQHGDLVRWVGYLAEEAGLGPPRVSVVQASTGEFTVPESLVAASEVVFTRDVVDGGETFTMLGVAARQVAQAAWRPARPWLGPLLAGAGLGLLLGLRDRFGGGVWPSLLALAGCVGLVAAAIQRGMAAGEARATWISQRAKELLGWLRTEHPEAFEELARRQGLLPDADAGISGTR